MITIAKHSDCVTIVEVFRLRDGRQAEVVARLNAVNEALSREPGWIAAAVHRSLDGQRVALYAQWRSEEAIRTAIRQPAVHPLLARLVEIAEPDWHLYEVVAVDVATGRES